MKYKYIRISLIILFLTFVIIISFGFPYFVKASKATDCILCKYLENTQPQNSIAIFSLHTGHIIFTGINGNGINSTDQLSFMVPPSTGSSLHIYRNGGCEINIQLSDNSTWNPAITSTFLCKDCFNRFVIAENPSDADDMLLYDIAFLDTATGTLYSIEKNQPDFEISDYSLNFQYSDTYIKVTISECFQSQK